MILKLTFLHFRSIILQYLIQINRSKLTLQHGIEPCWRDKLFHKEVQNPASLVEKLLVENLLKIFTMATSSTCPLGCVGTITYNVDA